MKIAILTFQTTNNFGAILQSYALQKVLKDHGHQVEIINYQCEYISKPYRFVNFKEKGAAGYLFSLIGYICYLPRTRSCNEFRKQLKYTSPLQKVDLKAVSDSYDMFIVGSDQVWNYKLTHGDYSYLFDFVEEDSKKFSYAASIGVSEIEESYLDSYYKLLKKFRCISVREKQGAEVLKGVLGEEVSVVLDPTLLLSADEWSKVARKPKLKDEYILVYQLGISKKLVDFAQRLSKKKNMRIIYIPFPLGGYVKAKCQWGIGPAEWLGLFMNASYIVTDSFHGTAFSILLNKTFFTEASGQHKGVGSRLYNLLDMFDLTECLVDNNLSLESVNNINYEHVNEILDAERSLSMKYIKDILNMAKK